MAIYDWCGKNEKRNLRENYDLKGYLKTKFKIQNDKLSTHVMYR